MEHRASTKSRHPSRFSASALASLHDILLLFKSLSTVLLHVVFGLPRFLFPCGFQSHTHLAMQLRDLLRVWPIHLHLLLVIVFLIGSCLVILQRSSFLIIFGHQMFSMYLRHLFTYACRLCTAALLIFQVSQPYSRTDKTLELKILTFVCGRICLDLHTGRS